MGLIGNGEELDDLVHSFIIKHLEVACLLDEGLWTDIVELLDGETRHLDKGSRHGIGVLTAHQTGTVGCEFRHSAPIVEGELQAAGYQTATRDCVYSPVDHLRHKMVQHVLRLDVTYLVAYNEEYLVIVTKVYQTGVENDDGILCSNGTGVDVIAPSDVQFRYLLQVENATGFQKILVYLGIVVPCDLQVTARILNVVHSLDEVGCHPFARRGEERDAFQFLQGGSVQRMLVLTVVETCEYLLVVCHNFK